VAVTTPYCTNLNKFGQEYIDKGREAYEARYRQQRIRWLEKQARELKLKIVAA